MPTCVPIKDLESTAAFTRTVESAAEPITVTRNGYDAFVVMKTDEYERQISPVRENSLFCRVSRMPEIAELGYRVALVRNYVALYFFRDDG